MNRLLSYLLAALLAVAPVAAQAQSVTSYPPTTANTIQPFSDSSNAIATDRFVQGRAALANSFTPFSNITGGTYSFATLGSGAVVVIFASGGVITGAITIGNPGSGYAVGDVVTPTGGNTDAYLRVTAVSGSGISAVQILYGGTGYTTGGSIQLSPAQTFPAVFSATGVLTTPVTVIIPNGSFLLGGQERTVINNTTGAFTTTLCVSNGANACTGTTLVIPQGTANSTPVYWFTDGSTGIWQINNAAAAGAGGLATNNTWSGVNTFNSGDLALAGSGSGSTTLSASATASGTLTLPAATDTLVGQSTTDTLTNKTLSASTLTGNTTLPGSGQISSAGFLGIGTTASSTVPISVAVNQNTGAIVNVANSSTGAAAQASVQASNGTHTGFLNMNGASFTTAGISRQDGLLIASNGAGGLTLDTQVSQPIYFAINSAQVAQFGGGGHFAYNNVETGTAGTGGGTAGGAACFTSSQELISNAANCIVSLTALKNIQGTIGLVEAVRETIGLVSIWYDVKADETHTEQPGFTAEQVASIDPRLAIYAPDGTLAGVRYEQISALFVQDFKMVALLLVGLGVWLLILSALPLFNRRADRG